MATLQTTLAHLLRWRNLRLINVINTVKAESVRMHEAVNLRRNIVHNRQHTHTSPPSVGPTTRRFYFCNSKPAQGGAGEGGG